MTPRQEDGAHQRAWPVVPPLAHLLDRHVTLLSAAGARQPFQGSEGQAICFCRANWASVPN